MGKDAISKNTRPSQTPNDQRGNGSSDFPIIFMLALLSVVIAIFYIFKDKIFKKEPINLKTILNEIDTPETSEPKSEPTSEQFKGVEV